MSEEIRLLNCDARELTPLPLAAGASLLFADPPWQYSDGSRSKLRGLAGTHYDVLPDKRVANILAEFYYVMAQDAYMLLWCTFPKLDEWLRAWAHEEWDFKDQDLRNWEYKTGGVWGKTSGPGVGHHFLGEAELLLLYKKGRAKPNQMGGNLWLCPRTDIHSEKPQAVLRRVVSLLVPPGGLVVDPFAGESASLALACRATGRRYVGAEISPERHALALARLSQQEMALLEPEELGAAS